KLFSPTNLDLDNSGNMYVSDTGAFNVKKYSADGKLLASYGSHGDALGQFARNKGIAVDREGRVYVVDAAFEKVQIFDQNGQLLLYFPESNDPAALVLPAGIAIDYDHIEYFKTDINSSFKVDYLIFVTSQYGNRKVSVFGFGKKE
ncbi:MAG: hypothetical protein Q8Q33_01200, partial [Chlamydiota bacterium]|nr:hypothetical protein [Chlamydiota bacterium]